MNVRVPCVVFSRGGNHSFLFYDLLLPFFQQCSDSVFLIDVTSAHEDVTTVRLPHISFCLVIRNASHLHPSSFLRSSSNRSLLFKDLAFFVCCQRTSRSNLPSLFFFLCCCCFLSLSCCCSFFFRLRCCGCTRGCCGNCRSWAACLSCAFVAKCLLACHRVCIFSIICSRIASSL